MLECYALEVSRIDEGEFWSAGVTWLWLRRNPFQSLQGIIAGILASDQLSESLS